MQRKRFNFNQKSNALGEISLVPTFPLILSNNSQAINVWGLLDTGASVNVLPYEIGLDLGLNWDDYNISVVLVGNLA